ncbi:MAG: type II secretion system F family protein [Phycisphaerae bacterium]|nr:type II secretion system F family protein [Phycisphaerae bacterium]
MSTLPSHHYLFQAMTAAGAKTLGFRAAPDEAQLADELRREQLMLLKSWRLPFRAPAQSWLPLKDEAALNDQLAILLSRGVPLVDSLEVASSVVSAASRGRIMRLREAVAAGLSFSDACAKSGAFDDVTIAVYRSAERTGDVSGAAKRLSISAKRRLGIRGKAITVMIYPLVVLSISVIVFSGLLIFLVPRIADQMRQMKTTPNAYSQAVFATGEWLNAHLGLTFGVVALLALGAVVLRERAFAGFMGLLQRVPAVARLILTVELTRFFSVMAAMVKSGVPLADALSTSASVLSSRRLRDQMGAVQRGLVEGGLWKTLVERTDALPLATRRLLIAAERAGDLDSAFDSLSQDMADEVEVRSSRLLALLEPGAILLMFMLIGPLILAIAIPLMTIRSGQ